jgi:ABC-type lipoprotein release transport system permease subunit
LPPLTLTFREIKHRWKSSALVSLIVAATTGTLTFFSVNNAGFQKEIGRSARDIGSNVVILPAEVDPFAYHNDGGYSDVTMSAAVVDQLIEYRASLNHLIPMLERQAGCSNGDRSVEARIVGIAASVPMPGRPKSPMQKSIPDGTIQLGSRLAEKLGVQRDEPSVIKIGNQDFEVSRVNRANGTWQDAAAFLDLQAAQSLFGLPERISRIEAIECTSEQCEATGLKSEVVLANELARITDQVTLLRRERMADARSSIRAISDDNFGLLQNVLWALLAMCLVGLSGSNAFQRKSEIGVLQALGYGQARVMAMFIMRAVWLTIIGAAVGILGGAFLARTQGCSLFIQTGAKISIDWSAAIMIGLIALLIAALASSLPAMLAATKSPSDLIGRDS